MLLPYGNTGYEFVRTGTILVCRCVLLIVVAAWRKVRWLLEQPDNSVLPLLPQWQWMLSVVEVWGPQKKGVFYFSFEISVQLWYMEDPVHEIV